jgi:hypothetical protein
MKILKVLIGLLLISTLNGVANAQTTTTTTINSPVVNFSWDYDDPNTSDYIFTVRLIRMRIDTCTCKDAVYNQTIKDYRVTGRLTAKITDLCTRFYDPTVRYAVIAKVKAKRISDGQVSPWSEPIIIDLNRSIAEFCANPGTQTGCFGLPRPPVIP